MCPIPLVVDFVFDIVVILVVCLTLVFGHNAQNLVIVSAIVIFKKVVAKNI